MDPRRTSQPWGKKHLHTVLGRLLPFRKCAVIGVDLGSDVVRLAKICRGADGRPILTQYASMPLPTDMAPQSDAFAGFLRATLDAFCAHDQQVEIWTAISSVQVETRYVRVPKVARRQLNKAVYWTYRREMPFDEANTLFGFDVLGERSGQGVRQYEVMAYTVPTSDVKATQDLFKKAGHPLTGVTIVPFSMQNALRARWLDADDQSLCTLYIGREFSRIDIFEGGHMVLSRVIKAGVRSMFDTLKEDLLARHFAEPGDLEQLISFEDLVSTEKQDETFIQVLAQRLHLDEDEILQMVLPAMERLFGQVERTIKHYGLHFDNSQVGNLFICGEVSIDMRIATLMTDHFGIRSRVIDLFAGPNVLTDVPAPQLRTERNHLISAMALALSSNGVTPNFLFTHADKARLTRIDCVNRGLAGALAATLLTISGVSLFQNHHIAAAAAQIAVLQDKLAQQEPNLDRDMINELVQQIQTGAAEIKRAAGKFLPLAILSELAELTPADIRLLQFEADLSDTPSKAKNVGDPATLKMTGIIFGDRLSLDIILASYTMQLKKSPLFSQAAVKERALKTYAQQTALNFTIHLTLEQ